MRPTMPQKRLSHDDYRAGWICPLEVEQIAAMEMLDEEHQPLPQLRSDTNIYNLGSINNHNVVIAGLPKPGNCSAATVLAQMKMAFPSLKYCLLVGIGGGVPVTTDNRMIRLGHVVVSEPTGIHSGAVQYDHGKARAGEFQRKGSLAPPPTALLNAAREVAVRRQRMDHDPIWKNTQRIKTSRPMLRRFKFPGAMNDHLYRPDYEHQQVGVPCAEGGCDPMERVERPRDDNNERIVVVHRGTIASGELVIKDAKKRDNLAREHGVLCFEMEAAGALADFPCIVIRGISDYCDSHKDDAWHGYAAAAAAAYARQLFFHLPIEPWQGPYESAAARLSGTQTNDFSVTFSLSEVPQIQHFIAREREIAEVRRALSSDGTRRVIVLHGLGGIGKTQLAVAYTKRYRDKYSAIFWFNIKDESSILQSFTKVARQILEQHPNASRLSALDLQQNHNEAVEAVKAWFNLPGNTQWLIVYDNYDNPKLTNHTSNTGVDINRFIPTAHQGSIIITTRLSQVDIGHPIQIRKLESTDDSLKILSSTSGRAGLQDDVDAKRLVEKLDGLPLALATAGAYLRRVSSSLADYLRIYEKSWARLHMSTPRLGSYEDRTLCSTWQVSYQQVQEQNPLAAHLLRWWAYFNNEDIWFELLQPDEEDSPAWIYDLADELNFNDAMGTLHDYGFVEPHTFIVDPFESRGYSMHGCLHSWTIHILNQEWDDYLGKLAVKCIASRVPSRNDPQFWLLQRRLLSHAMTSCAAIQASNEDLNWAFYNLGNLYADQGKLQEAKEMYLRALDGMEKACGPDHTSKLDTVNNLGILYATQGKFREAEEMLLRALQGKEKAWGLDRISTLDTVNNLGLLYVDQGKPQEAEEMYLRALQGYEKAWGPDHTSTLDTVNNLGILYMDQGKLQEAEEMYLRALQGKEKEWGLDHTSTLDTVNNLGLLYVDQGKPQEAEEMYLRALQGYKKAWGPDHISTLDTVNNLGNLYATQGKLQEAEEMYLRALQGKEKAWGLDHTSTLDTVNNLGNLYADQDKLQEAEEMFLRALQGYEKVIEPQNITRYRPAINITWGLGSLLWTQGQLVEAKAYYQRAYNNLKGLLGSSHKDVQLLQSTLLDLNRTIEAGSVDEDMPTPTPTQSRKNSRREAL